MDDKQDRSTLAKLGAHSKWMRVEDRSQATEPARKAFDDKFVREVKDRFGELPPDELAFRVEHARKAYYTRLQLASMRSRRRKKKAVDATDGHPEQVPAVKTASDAPDAVRTV